MNSSWSLLQFFLQKNSDVSPLGKVCLAAILKSCAADRTAEDSDIRMEIGVADVSLMIWIPSNTSLQILP